MFRQLILKGNFDWLKALAAIALWIVALAYLVHFYGQPLKYAFIDIFIHNLLVLLGFFVLENIFRYFLPTRSQSWIVVSLGLVLAIGIVFTGKFILQGLLEAEHQYFIFADHSMLVKGLIVFILISCWSALLIFNAKIDDQMKSKERQEKIDQLAKEAELYHLRQQLQPHFLFNSLNSISSLIKSNPGKAREMVLQLADFLRGTIKKDDRVWMSVSEEIDYLGLYLEIEKLRFGHRLKVDFQVEENCSTLKVPPLMIQPLLENAIKHGLYGVVGDVLITIKFFEANKVLKVYLSNPYDPKMGQARGTGFGLEAVKRRLYLLFGRNDLLETSKSEDEFIVNLNIPQFYD